MRIRTLAVGLLAGGLALTTLTACGKEGTPTTPGSGDQSGTNAPAALTYPVATGVDLAGSPVFAKMKSAGALTVTDGGGHRNGVRRAQGEQTPHDHGGIAERRM